jgi:RimK-like ATP-grasp domain
MLILLWGLGSERPLAAVREELDRLGAPTRLIDQRHAPNTEICLDVDSGVSGCVRMRDEKIDLGAVTALYLRPYDSRCLPSIANAGPNSPAWGHTLAVDNILLSWSEITPALVVNRLGAMATNSSKPYQLRQIQRLGFSVPETLITTDPGAAQAFWERHGTVIYKSVSAARSRVSRLRPEHVQRLGDVSSCPTQFQQYIAGRDYRVHVVDTEIFACEVLCEADDYRSPGEHTIEIQACRLPQDVEDRCRLLATAMQLPLAGIDLRRSPEGDWYCFEVNPSPAFTYYQEATDQPISQAIARLLATGQG